MKIPITKYGLPEAAVYPLCIAAAMTAAFLLKKFISPSWAFWVIELVLFVVLVWVLSFFRDPKRTIPSGNSLILSPADGRISDIETVKMGELSNEPVLRIGIFLSIFNVHINRMPCRVKVENIVYKEGLFKNALSPESAKVNESNSVFLKKLDNPCDKIMVRQISGAIARRIVCRAKIAEQFQAGQQFGMIKFGSRTEIYIPQTAGLACEIKIGDKVKAGSTILARYSDGN